MLRPLEAAGFNHAEAQPIKAEEEHLQIVLHSFHHGFLYTNCALLSQHLALAYQAARAQPRATHQ